MNHGEFGNDMFGDVPVENEININSSGIITRYLTTTKRNPCTGLILALRPANERRLAKPFS